MTLTGNLPLKRSRSFSKKRGNRVLFLIRTPFLFQIRCMNVQHIIRSQKE